MERIFILSSSQMKPGPETVHRHVSHGGGNNRCDCSAKFGHLVCLHLETNVPCRCEPSPLLCCAQLGSDIETKRGLTFSLCQPLCASKKKTGRLGSDCAWSCWLFSSIRSGPVTSLEMSRACSKRRAVHVQRGEPRVETLAMSSIASCAQECAFE